MLSEQFDTVYPTSVDPEADMRTVRIRGTSLGRLTPGGWFEAAQAPVQIDVNVVRRDGQWRIARAARAGCSCGCRTSGSTTAPVKTWFVDPVRRVAVPDLRYLPGTPARAQAARAMELLFAGPSTALQGAASTMLVANAQLRSNVATSPEGALIVDLTQLGDLDEGGRRLLAAQVVLSLAEVSVGRVRLLADGAPLLPDRPDLTRDDVASLDRRARAGDGARPGRLRRPACTSSTAASSTPRCPGRSATASWPCSRRRRARTGGASRWSPPTARDAGCSWVVPRAPPRRSAWRRAR